MKQILQTLKLLRSHKTYVYYSLAYGLSTLVVPLGVQFLVNNLALSGIWLNTTAFIVFIVIGLVLTQTIKHSQLILVESLLREIFCLEIAGWRSAKVGGKSQYYFEVLNLLKSFSKSYSNIIETALVMLFGLTTIIFFHPTFLALAVIILLTVYQIYASSGSALRTSIEESNQKYRLYDKVHAEEEIRDEDVRDFLSARDRHFCFVRRNSFKIAGLVVVTQFVLLILGCYLIKIGQLSVGQLVSAEIILSGIFVPLAKLPQTLEAIYDYETSKYKIQKAFSGGAT